MQTAAPERSNYRILIVDDNEAIHDDLRKILDGEPEGHSGLLEDEELLFDTAIVKSSRFEIDSAYQGQEGLEMVNRAVSEGRPYALAFVDIRMPPGWDGIETVCHLWKTSPDLQVVICTAYSDYSWNDMVRKLGHSDSMVILKKPFDNIEVTQLAHALSRKWSVSHEARAKRQDLERMVQQATSELRYHANHDTLTDLPNRRLFADRLQQAILSSRRSGDDLALLYLDLDGFKVVNDTLGHALGDLLLIEVARRMQNCLRKCDTLARMGGDEFTIIASGLTSPDGAMALAGRLQCSLQAPFHIDGNALFVTCSIGISQYPIDGMDVTGLLRSADAAMYEAKGRGKNRIVAYTTEIGHAASDRLELETALRYALLNGELSLHYQPEFELATQRMVRFEALLRWDNPTLGSVEPARFIPIAEECGMIWEIGTWVIAEACRTAKKWSEAGCANVPVAVNISAHQFCRIEFIDTIIDILNRTPIDPGLLELELTESVIVRDFDDLAPKIKRLRELGVGVSIDDFGSGYSSFSYLEKLPVTAVKVDRAFVQGIESAPRILSIVKGMVALAHSIGLRVVVEGVETAEQLDALLHSNADEVQGYLLGYPIPLEELMPRIMTAEVEGGAEKGLLVA